MKTLYRFLTVIGLMLLSTVCFAEDWYEAEEASAGNYSCPTDKIIRSEATGMNGYIPNDDVRHITTAEMAVQMDGRTSDGVAVASIASGGSTRSESPSFGGGHMTGLVFSPPPDE
jgi:hypothetical protein